MTLEKAGHTVISQLVGLYAISEIARARPDCILIDLVMGGIDGLQLCRELRAHPRTQDTSIVVVTAKEGETWRRRAMDAGANAFFTKPIDGAAFLATLERLAQQRNG
jgi:CheY-like chemotaxis protein